MAESDPEEFFDCTEEAISSCIKSTGLKVLNPNGFKDKEIKHSTNGGVKSRGQKHPEKSIWGGRCVLPETMISRNDFSVWSILKQCIGKELSKITMPIVFNEPLSFLQRVVEYMEYSSLLMRASESIDPVERLEFVTAFAVSATASNWDRIGKPFNPLLGETYELVREDLGLKIVCEQVSHHPPISAFHVDSPLYTFHGAICPKIKFWGKSVEVTPKGLVTLYLKKHNESYSWQNVDCCVHNIIVGKLWIEHYGAMEVTNHRNNYKSVLNFRPSGWFGKDLHKVEGFMYDDNKMKLKAFYGKWIEALYSYDVSVWEDYVNSPNNVPEAAIKPSSSSSVKLSSGTSKTESNSSKSLSKVQSEPVMPFTDDLDMPEGTVPVRGSSCDLGLSGQKLLWVASPKPPYSAQYYSFTLFAMMLNELDDNIIASSLPPTDCRLRPDIRLMEEGKIDAAGEEKNRLEEKQRTFRKDRKKKKNSEFEPLWFTMSTDRHTGKEDWLSTGEYWKRNWQNCPDIY